jgi:hypothetical protein
MTALLPPESLLNSRYRVVAHVGQGDMGSVYKALCGIYQIFTMRNK